MKLQLFTEIVTFFPRRVKDERDGKSVRKYIYFFDKCVILYFIDNYSNAVLITIRIFLSNLYVYFVIKIIFTHNISTGKNNFLFFARNKRITSKRLKKDFTCTFTLFFAVIACLHLFFIRISIAYDKSQNDG